ncbi:siderophore synthetase, partial [Streptomyces sp. SID5473]|nr:IucA/IucC family protein [Streptomyces tsukubensis NRRL18488]MYS64649.1 siderophore synthetase [Streptomyces sp. SID5473]
MTATTTTTPLALATEPLHGLDPRAAAEHAHLEALLRVRLLESGVEPAAGPLRIDLPALGLALVTEVVHRSPSGWHRFGPV